MRKHVYYDKQELCDLIYGFAAANPDEWLTRSNICKGIKRSKAPHVLSMIEQLVDGGWLKKREETLPHGFIMFLYQVTDKSPVAACEGLENVS